jgi:hypothetical protein
VNPAPAELAEQPPAKEKTSLDQLGTLDDFKKEDRRKASAP